jgi:hypothetical protein
MQTGVPPIVIGKLTRQRRRIATFLRLTGMVEAG